MLLIYMLLKLIYLKLKTQQIILCNTHDIKVIRSENYQVLVLNYFEQNTFFLNQYKISNRLFYSLIINLGSPEKIRHKLQQSKKG